MRFGLLRAMALTCVLIAPVFAQRALPVAKVVEFVKSSIAEKIPDKDVAAYLASVRLTQKLEDSTIEDLQTAGAGVKTVAALVHLADLSAQLTAAAPPPPPPPVSTGPPPPSREEQDRILREVREFALNYSKSIPDFLCLQVTTRFADRHFQPSSPGSWSQYDRILEKLSFLDHQEKYELISQNDTALFGKTWESVGGAISRGEWASLMRDIFDPETDATFRWLRWGNLDGKLYHVYEYRIDKQHSRETIDFSKQQQVTPAFHGLIYVPAHASVVWQITVEPEIPADFPIQNVSETLKYGYAEISGQRFLLPASSEVVMRTGREGNKNHIEFRKYQKYSADTSIKFDDTDDPTPVPAKP